MTMMLIKLEWIIPHIVVIILNLNYFCDAKSPFSPFRFSGYNSGLQGGLFDRNNRLALQKLGGAKDLDRARDKRNYVDLQCRGMYDQGIFAQLDRICEDCYNLYKDAEVHGFCRSDCFTSQTFRQCLQSLLLEKESEYYLELVEILGKKKKK